MCLFSFIYIIQVAEVQPITIMNCDVAQYFHVRWAGDVIEVLKGGSSIIRYQDPSPLNVRHMAVFTVSNHEAVFRFAHAPGESVCVTSNRVLRTVWAEVVD